MTAPHHAQVVIDLAALRGNVRAIRARIGPDVVFYAVCKGGAYGCGVAEVARVCAAEGVDAFAIGDAGEAAVIRGQGIRLPILLYGVTAPALAAEVARLGVMVTIFDAAGLAAYAALPGGVEAFLEIDCGLGRLGFAPAEVPALLERLAAAPGIRLRGLYTHLAALDDAAQVAAQMRRFAIAVDAARASGRNDLQFMAASSRVVADYPECNLNAVNPGRALYGLVYGPLAESLGARPVISAITTRVIQVKDLAGDMRLGYVDGDTRRGRPMRGAVIAIGFTGGFQRALNGGVVLVRGRRLPVVGEMSMEHTLLDATDAPDVAVGDEAVLLGAQAGDEITPAEVGRMAGVLPLEILPRLARTLPRVYRD